MKHGTNSEEGNTIHEIYAFSHTETWLEDYAKSNHLDPHELTARVAGLLTAQGEWLLDRVPTKPRSQTAKVSEAQLRKMAVHGGSRIQVQRLKPKKRRHYKGLHWTQKPENKAKLLRILKKSAKKRRQALASTPTAA